MKISARNQIARTVKRINHGAVDTELVLEVAPGVEITSVTTKSSAESLGLTEGSRAIAVIKASIVMIAVDRS